MGIAGLWVIQGMQSMLLLGQMMVLKVLPTQVGRTLLMIGSVAARSSEVCWDANHPIQPHKLSRQRRSCDHNTPLSTQPSLAQTRIRALTLT